MSSGIEFIPIYDPPPLPTGAKLRDDFKRLIPMSENIYPISKEPSPIMENQTQVVNDDSFVAGFASKLSNLRGQLETAMRIQVGAVNDAIAAGDDLVRLADRKNRYDSFAASEMWIRQQYETAAKEYLNKKLIQPFPEELPDLVSQYPLQTMISEAEHLRRMRIFNHQTEQIVQIQTQVIDEPMQVFTAETIQNNSVLAEYKDALSKARLNRVTYIQQISGLQTEIKDLLNSRENLIQMFNSEALSMYPELQGQDVFAALASLSTFHPLYQLWDQYRPKIDEVTAITKDKFGQLETFHKGADDLYSQEQIIFNSYADFQSTASTQLPTPEELLAQLQAIEAIPYVEESTLRAELNAIELLNPAAAAMVTLQTLENENEGDYSESPEQIDTQENVQVRPMAFSFDEESGSPTMPQAAAIAPAIVSEMIDPLVANTKLRNMGMCLGVAAIAYLILGGKNRATT